MAGFRRQTKTEAQPVPAHDDDEDNKVEMNNVMRMTALVVLVLSLRSSVGSTGKHGFKLFGRMLGRLGPVPTIFLVGASYDHHMITTTSH